MMRRRDYKPKPVRSCERCETQLVPRIFSGKEEAYTAFMNRRFCSLICSNTRGQKGKSRTQQMVQARGAALKENCECCGGRERLAIHHINEVWRDGRLENLQTLCVFCHQQWHGLHRKWGIRCSTPMPPLASLYRIPKVRIAHKVHWGDFDPRTASPGCADMVTP